MKQEIESAIQHLEEELRIKVLFACETGSRAWGFPSPDSDYDVRLIYVHSLDWYLQLSEPKDTLDRMLADREIDISGWEIRKSLRLLQKSNAALLERIQSPILYQFDDSFLQQIHQLAPQFYSRISTLHHYLGLAKKSFAPISNVPSYRLKKFFYALRAASVCQWILEKDEVPPIEFPKVLAGIPVSESIRERIRELISLKATVSESYEHKGEPEILTFIAHAIEQAEAKGSKLPAAKGDTKSLNTFLWEILQD